MDVPVEIIRQISLYLPHNFLFLSKELKSIYDKNWYHDSMILQCPNYKYDNWKDLYYKSTQSGEIYYYNGGNEFVDKLPINGIKVSDFYMRPYFYKMILTFDGNLYLYNIKNQEVILFDKDVKDISNYAYIKAKQFFTIDHNLQPKLLLESESEILAIADDREQFIAVITDNMLYHYDIEHDDISKFACENGMNLMFNGSFIIQESDGKTVSFNYNEDIFVKLNIPLIKMMKSGLAQLITNELVTLAYYYIENDDIEKDELIEKLEMIPLPIKGKMINSSVCLDYYFIVIDNNFYRYDSETGQYYLIRNNVKGVFANVHVII